MLGETNNMASLVIMASKLYRIFGEWYLSCGYTDQEKEVRNIDIFFLFNWNKRPARKNLYYFGICCGLHAELWWNLFFFF